MHSIAEYLRYTYIPLFTRISFNFDHIPTRTTTMDPRLLYSYYAMPTQDCTSLPHSQKSHIKGFELGWERFKGDLEFKHAQRFARATIQLHAHFRFQAASASPRIVRSASIPLHDRNEHKISYTIFVWFLVEIFISTIKIYNLFGNIRCLLINIYIIKQQNYLCY